MRRTAGPSGRPHDDLEPLAVGAAHRDDEAAARLELVVERGRRLERGGCDGDRGERRALGNAARAVADVEVDAVLVARRGEIRARSFRELRDPLDRVHLGGELGEHRGLIARARADVEHPLAALQRELLADERDHVRLRDRLLAADRQRGVGVRGLAQLRREKELTRHASHRGEHALVVDAAPAELPLHHPRPLLSRHRRRASIDSGTATPKCASTAGATSVIRCSSAWSPTVTTGTNESPATSEP